MRIVSKHTTRLLALICIIWCSAPDQAKAQRNGYFLSNGQQVNIDAFNTAVKNMMDSVGVPGLSLAVMEDGKVVYYNTYGIRNREEGKKVDKTTVFEACSLSKSFLVFVAHQLVDEGRLDLDKPMYQYQWSDRLAHDPRYKLITPRMILSHSSGMENWGSEHNPDTLEILKDPGTEFVYSGEGYNYLASVISIILGQTYAEYVDQRIIQPLGLKGTYLNFTKKKTGPFTKVTPQNYATGYSYFREPFGKWKNMRPVPSSGYNLTAKDYATLIVSLFNEKYLSPSRTREIYQPVVRAQKDDPLMFLGEGFEVIHTPHDTIITQDGSNPGFKAAVFYSVVNKRGFVFLSNYDRGASLAGRLNALTAALDIKHRFEQDYSEQYPNKAADLFKVYRDKQAEGMFAAIEKLTQQHALGENTLNELAHTFLTCDDGITARLLEQNLALYPQSATAYQLKGELHMKMNAFDFAAKDFAKAIELGCKDREVGYELQEALRELKAADPAKRRGLMVQVNEAGKTVVQAEDYNATFGIKQRPTEDAGGGYCINNTTTGHWMDYKMNVPAAGVYTIALRVASVPGKAWIEIRSGAEKLGRVEVPPTKGWEKWVTVGTKVSLPAGSQVLRLYVAGGQFDMNWFQLEKEKYNIDLKNSVSKTN
jgi:CubicO group peptidase (beta-lactamase class C family)